MKKTIRPSILPVFLVMLIFAILIGFMFYFDKTWIVIPVLVVLLFVGMYYRLLSVTADENELSINRFLRTTKIPMSEIASVKRFPHPKGLPAILGGGYIWGNSGWFQVPGQGKCFAYFDNPKDCILLTLKSGKKYLLACEDPDQITDHINVCIKQLGRHL